MHTFFVETPDDSKDVQDLSLPNLVVHLDHHIQAACARGLHLAKTKAVPPRQGALLPSCQLAARQTDKHTVLKHHLVRSLL